METALSAPATADTQVIHVVSTQEEAREAARVLQQVFAESDRTIDEVAERCEDALLVAYESKVHKYLGVSWSEFCEDLGIIRSHSFKMLDKARFQRKMDAVTAGSGVRVRVQESWSRETFRTRTEVEVLGEAASILASSSSAEAAERIPAMVSRHSAAASKLPAARRPPRVVEAPSRPKLVVTADGPADDPWAGYSAASRRIFVARAYECVAAVTTADPKMPPPEAVAAWVMAGDEHRFNHTPEAIEWWQRFWDAFSSRR